MVRQISTFFNINFRIKALLQSKSLLLFALVFLFVSQVNADITITTPTGGQNVSADKAVGGPSAGYTALGSIVLTDNTTGDFAPSSNITLVFTAPTGWQFQPGVGSVSRSVNKFTSASVSVTATTITVTYTSVSSGVTGNYLSIDNIQVQPTNGAVNGTANITRTGGTAAIAGFPVTAYVASLSKTAGAFAKLQVLLPGETNSPGGTGKTGTAITQSAGTAFPITVNAVDAAFNIVTSAPANNIQITSSDVNAALPANNTLNAGSQTFNVILKTAGTRTITATNLTDVSKTAGTSSNITVSAGAFVKLQLLVPGETAAPGTVTGKTGTANPVISGVAFTITVNAVDANWNIVTPAHSITISATGATNAVIPSNATLNNGTITFSVTFKTVGETPILYATDFNDDTIIAGQSPALNVIAGAFAKLQILLPGETAAPGTTTGKTGTPDPQTAGVAFNVIVNAVDASWNLVSTATDVIGLTSSDVNAVLPANVALVNGTRTYSVTLRTVGTRTITATDITDGTKTAITSGSITLVAGAYAKMQVLLPGETAAPGTITGVTGNKSIPARNTSFQIRIIPVDNCFNVVSGITNSISFTSSDASATLPATTTLVNNGTRTSNVTLRTAGPQTITVTDASTGFTTTVTVPDPTIASVLTDYFRSVNSGNWNDAASWESSTDGITNWHAATLTPTSGSATITIRNGNTITVIASVSVDQVDIQAGGEVIVKTGTMTIANGAEATDFSVSGTLTNSSTITTTGTLVIANGGKYKHAYTTASGTIPTATWSAGSICEISGYTTYTGAITGIAQTFSDFVWNCPNQNISNNGPTLPGTLSVRDFTINSTGSGVLHLATTGGTTSISRNFNQTGGTLILNKTSGTTTLNIAGNFTIGGGVFKTNTASTLNIQGDWSSTGGTIDFITNNLSVTFNGANQNISDNGVNSGNGITFKNVTFSGGGTKTLSATGKFNVNTDGILKMLGSSILQTSGNLILKSGATSTATVSSIPSTASIQGNVTVERYIKGGPKAMYRTYRMFSSPVYDNSSSFINSNVSGNRTYKFSQFIDDMIITGPGGVANGFDASAGNGATAFTYNANFIAIPNINTAVNIGRGAYIFYRGNRNNFSSKTTSPFVDPEATVMTYKGILNQQDITVPLTYGTASNGGVGYNLLGNPYAASIDWNSSNITKTNMSNTVRIWNPAIRQYATYNGTDSVNGGSRYIASGQAFFVQASNSSGSITFRESAKVGANAQPSTMLLSVGAKQVQDEVTPSETEEVVATKIRIKMIKEQTDNVDESVIVLKQGGNEKYTDDDVSHYNGEEVFLSSLSKDQNQLAINYMPEVANVPYVGLNVTATSTGNYFLAFNLENVPLGYTVQLKDRYLNKINDVNEGFSYPLTINKTDTASFGSNRFLLMINAPKTLPVKLISFNAAKVTEGVLVKWVTVTETNNHHFEVERAGDDKIFVSIGTVLPKGAGSYTFIDKTPILGNNYYRLKQVDISGTPTTFEPVVIRFDLASINSSSTSLSVYPNPVINDFTVRYNNSISTNKLQVRIIEPSGQLLLNKTVSPTDLLNGYQINFSGQKTGIYILDIIDPLTNKKIGSSKVIKM